VGEPGDEEARAVAVVSGDEVDSVALHGIVLASPGGADVQGSTFEEFAAAASCEAPRGVERHGRHELPIVRRQRQGAASGNAQVLSVFCPRDELTIDASTCADCSECERLVIDALGSDGSTRGLLICRSGGAARRTVSRTEGVEADPTNPTKPRDEDTDARPACTVPTCDPHGTPVSAIMTRQVMCVTAEVEAEMLFAVLLDRNISGAPVVDAAGELVGVVSKTDVIRACHEQSGVDLWEGGEPVTAAGREAEQVRMAQVLGSEFVADRDTRGAAPGRPGLKVGDLMTPLRLTILESASVAQAAALMVYESVHRLPVVSSAGELVGMITPSDILRWLAQHSRFAATVMRGQRRGHDQGYEP
jgi:CBS domain-containing protein